MSATSMPSSLTSSRRAPRALGRVIMALCERGEIRMPAHVALAGLRDSVAAAAGAGLSVLRRASRCAGSREEPGSGNYLFSGFSAFAIMGPALFGVGCTLALERDAGFLRLKRALPAPGGAYLFAKMVVAGDLCRIDDDVDARGGTHRWQGHFVGGQLAIIATVMIVGSVPFAAIGLFIGAFTSGSSAPAYANVLFLPMLWLSGLFIPLPKFLEPWAVIWPAFHVNQVALGFAGVSEFSFMAPSISAAVLAGVTVLFGGLAIRRLARRG